MNARNICLENLINILEKGRPLHLVLADSLSDGMTREDRAFISRLTRGVTERCLSIDYIIDSVSSIKCKKLKPVIRNILRSGIYQIIFMDSVTDFAACDEAVKLAGKRGFKNLGGFVNGVLRSCCRQAEEFKKLFFISDGNEDEKPADTEENKSPEALSIKYSMPAWIISEWLERYSYQDVVSALRYFLRETGICIRVNESKADSLDIYNVLKAKGYEIEKHPLSNKCFVLKNAGRPDTIDEFNNGSFVVQDLSSCLEGLCAGINSDMSVLDLCAAPGGKTLHAADLGARQVVACDLTDRKTSMITEAVVRCGFENVIVFENDASRFNPEFEDSFDVVLCDVPCSGLGIIGKKPDIKYNAEKNPDELTGLQKKILENAVKYLHRGGVLVYSTCTVRDCENINMYDYCIGSLGLRAESLNRYIPEEMHSAATEDGWLQLLPGQYGTDGFFIARFRK